MKSRTYGLLASGLVLAVAMTGAVSGTAMQDGDDEEHQTRIHIERQGGTEGEKSVRRHKVVFVGEDGEMQEIEGEGGSYSWFGGEHGHHMKMRLPGFALREGAFLGVATTHLTPELRLHFGAPEDAGVMISEIVDDSAAFSAGLQVGDIITAVDGERIESARHLIHAIRGHDEGDAVTVEIYRDGKVQDVSAVLGKTEHRAFDFEAGPGFGHLGGALKIDCEEEGGDCDIFLGRQLDLCGDEENCMVNISCGEGEGDCTCTVNGEETDCGELHETHGVRMHRMHGHSDD